MLLMGILLGVAAALVTAVWVVRAHRERGSVAELVWNDVFRCEATESADAQTCSSIWKRSDVTPLAEAS